MSVFRVRVILIHPVTSRPLHDSLKTQRSAVAKIEAKIDALLDQLCACCSGKAGTAQQPTPTPTGETLKKVFDSVHIGIGIGGGRTVGGGDHERGQTSKIQKSKTISSGCKCHPCTCH
jgi:hypothetical protein